MRYLTPLLTYDPTRVALLLVIAITFAAIVATWALLKIRERWHARSALARHANLRERASRRLEEQPARHPVAPIVPMSPDVAGVLGASGLATCLPS